MTTKAIRLPARKDCRHFCGETNSCKVLTELLCTKKQNCGFHQDEEARRRGPTRARAHEDLKAHSEEVRKCRTTTNAPTAE